MRYYFSILYILLTIFFAHEDSFASETQVQDLRLGKSMVFSPRFTFENSLPHSFEIENKSYFLTTNKVQKEHVVIDEFKNTPLFCELEFTSYGNVINPYTWEYDAVNGVQNMTTVFYNAYYELEKRGKITPYASVGLGMAWIGERGESNISGLSEVSELAWNAGLGFDFVASKDVHIDVGYRYSDTNIASNSNYLELTRSGKEENVHQLIFNIQYVF